jgi:uncharacterized protein YlxW (UPF0749 family)
MQRSNLIFIGIGLVLFISAVCYIIRYQTSSVNEIFKHHREQLENEIKAIQAERQKLKLTIDSLDRAISVQQVELLHDIDNFLKKHDKK